MQSISRTLCLVVVSSPIFVHCLYKKYIKQVARIVRQCRNMPIVLIQNAFDGMMLLDIPTPMYNLRSYSFEFS